jgi:hypothetical protein
MMWNLKVSQRIFLLVITISVIQFFFSCKKDSSANPAISNVPAIQLKSLTPDTVHNLKDSLLFVIKYTDGDGDIGDENADTLSLWITDNRFPLTEKFHIIPLAPQGTSIPITGDLNVVLDHIILKDESSLSESATFSVKLKDRAGNWSNTVTSAGVIILQ